jgi:predicted phage tail protein
MIKIKYIKNIFDSTQQYSKLLPYKFEKTLQEYITESEFPQKDCKIIVSGRVETNLLSIVENQDEIIITPNIEKSSGQIFGYTGMALTVLSMFVPGGALVRFGVLASGLFLTNVGASLEGNRLRKKGNGNADSGDNSFEDSSQTYGWDGIQTIQDIGVPVPIIYGEHRVGGNIINMNIENIKQDPYYYAPIIIENVSGGVVDRMELDQTIFHCDDNIIMIKFRIPAATYLSSTGTDGTKYYSNVKYIVSYKIFDGAPTTGTYTTHATYGGDGLSHSIYQKARPGGGPAMPVITYYKYHEYYDVQIELAEEDYYFKIDASLSSVYIAPYNCTAKFKVDTTSVVNNQVMNMLIGLGEGEIDSINNVQINNNDINNFKDVDVYKRLGTNGQSIIQRFADLNNIFSINTKLNFGSSYTYTTDEDDVEGFEIQFYCPDGIYEVNEDTGENEVWEVKYHIEYKLHSSGTWIDSGYYTLSFKTRNAINQAFYQDGLTAGQYDIRVTKISADPSTYTVGDLYIQYINEINKDDMLYPNTALLGLRMLATDQLSGGIPNITADVRGIKVSVPRIMYSGAEVAWEEYYWDPINSQYKRFADDAVCTWDGTTFITLWSANPIWCLKDLLINKRYGLGEYIDSTMISSADFLSMSRYCEEKVLNGAGAYEKRYQLNIVLDGTSSALDMIMQICNTFNGLAFYSNGTISVKIDKKDTPTQLFSMGNIIKDSFSQSWKSLKEIPNIIEVQYLDKNKGYAQETIAISDETAIAAGDPIRKQQARVFATSASYATRLGRFMLWQAKYINRAISFKASIDAITCQAGDLISVSHDLPLWGVSGRVHTGSTTSLVKLDRSVTIEAGKTYKLRVRLNSDTIEEKTVTDAAGTYTEVNVSVAFSSAPAAYDIFMFGENLKVKKDFRIIAIQKDSKNEASISAIEYDENIYDDTDVVLPIDNNSLLKPGIPEIENLKLTERIVKMADGSIKDCIDIWFSKPIMNDYYVKAYNHARIYISYNDGAIWSFQGQTNAEHFSIQDDISDGQEYIIAVVSVDPYGRENSINTSPQATINVIGKMAPPADVSSFSVMKDGDDIVFNWSPNPDVDLSHYEIREGDTWARGTIVATLLKTNYFRMPIFAFGERRYMIKAVDSSYNESLNESHQVLEIITAIDIFTYQDDNLDVWADGSQEITTDSENIVDSAGAQIVDSSANEISALVYGFEEKTNITNDPVVDSLNNIIVSNENIPIITNDIVAAFLQSKYFSDHYASQGIYVSKVVDLLSVINARLTVNINFEGDNCAYILYIKTSNDNITWSAWSIFCNAEYECRYFCIKVVVNNNDTTKYFRLWNLKSKTTIRNISESVADEAVTNTKNITFTKTYHVKVQVYAIAAGTNYARITAKSLAGFTVAIRRDSDGALTTGTCDWQTKGY